MRLASLTLHGFKSFGDRTTIEFSPRVTAVVGPNGSGKSNIIDALRWASGGGRAREFRADEKTDLIFHGAAGRKGVSYAEVELELKGASGRLHISRNLFRDGGSKLSLNGRGARFLDLDDALSGSGLGRGGLALIGQGEVSGVLMADPATLLGYVAEAAGVAKLSGRRDGAAARLGAARDHLARLEDVLNELRAGVARLGAEAGEAARAAALGREVLQLRYTLSVRRVEALEAEIGALREKAAEGRAAVAAGRDALSSAQERWREARRVLGEREESYRRAVGELEARRGDLRVAQERLKGTQARAEALQREAASLAEETAALEATPPPTPPEGDGAALGAEVTRAGEAAAAAERAAGDAEKTLSVQTRLFEAARAAENERARAFAAYGSQRRTLEAQLQEVRERQGALPQVDPEEVTALEEEVATARAALEEAGSGARGGACWARERPTSPRQRPRRGAGALARSRAGPERFRGAAGLRPRAAAGAHLWDRGRHRLRRRPCAGACGLRDGFRQRPRSTRGERGGRGRGGRAGGAQTPQKGGRLGHAAAARARVGPGGGARRVWGRAGRGRPPPGSCLLRGALRGRVRLAPRQHGRREVHRRGGGARAGAHLEAPTGSPWRATCSRPPAR